MALSRPRDVTVKLPEVVRGALANCEPNLRRWLIDKYAESPDLKGMFRWLKDNGALDDFGRITAPGWVEPQPVCAPGECKPVRKQDIARVVTRQATRRTRVPCKRQYAPDWKKPDIKTRCGKFHDKSEPCGKNRAVKPQGYAW